VVSAEWSSGSSDPEKESVTSKAHALVGISLLSATALATGGSHHSDAGEETPRAPLWQVGAAGQGVPAVLGPTVYFLGAGHQAIAVHAASGSVRWTATVGREPGPTIGFRVVAAGDLVLAGDDDIVALRRRDGRLAWRFAPGEGFGPGVFLGAADDEMVVAGSSAGRVYAIDLMTGRQVWSRIVQEASTVFEPTVDREVVLAGYTAFTTPAKGGVAALDRTSGKMLWRTPFPRPDDSTLGTGWAGGPLAAGDIVVAAAGDGAIYGLSRATGAVRWTIPRLELPLPGAAGHPDRDFRALTIADGTLIAGSLTGYVAAYDLATRKERWRSFAPLDGSVGYRIATDRRLVYVPYQSGRLLALDAKTGAERWRIGHPTGPRYQWPPAISGARLYLATAAGLFAWPAGMNLGGGAS
jgi:outer membrane protein assembly factor BamB